MTPDPQAQRPRPKPRDVARRLLPRTWRGCVAAGLLLGCLGTAASLYVAIRRGAHVQPTRPADVIIVLGAGWERPLRQPKRVYRNRLRYGQDLYEQGLAEHIIVTEQSPAAEIAREYLVSRGVPEDAIRVENRSTTTWQNLRFAQEIMRANGWRTAIVVSDGFHLPRCLRMCDDLGLRAEGAATPYSSIEQHPYRRVKYTLREVGTWVVYRVRGY
jgi:uncharacterized SAM-binding protein YcdF (DUF218 family)